MTSVAGTDLSVVPAGLDDVDVIVGLLHEFLNELSHGQGPSAETLRRTARELLDADLVIGLIAYQGTDPVGLLMLNECAAVYAGGRFGEITELCVKPAHRSQGVAAKLIAEARTVAKARGWTRFEVGAPDQPAWHRTLEFYLREGFEEVGPRLRLLL